MLRLLLLAVVVVVMVVKARQRRILNVQRSVVPSLRVRCAGGLRRGKGKRGFGQRQQLLRVPEQ